MKFGPKRGHFMCIFERFFRDFGLLLAAIVLYLILRDPQIILDNAALVVLVLFAPVSRLIQYLCTYYTIDDKRLLVESGWLNKKKQEVPIANITTVDFTQTFIFQLTHVYRLNVETASSIGSGPSGAVKLVLKDRDAVFVKKLLLAKVGDEEEAGRIEEGKAEERRFEDAGEATGISEEISGNTIMASAGEVFLMGLLRSKVWIVGQVMVYGSMAISLFGKLVLDKNLDGDEVLLDYLMRISAPLLIIAIIAAFYLISVALSLALSCVKYYGFRITDREDSIFIEYGLLTKKNHTLMKEKISGISYRQSFLMGIFRQGTLEVFAAGYGGTDDNNQVETAILYPIMREEKLNAFLLRFFPEIQAKEPVKRAEPKAFPYFFICGRFFFTAALLAAMLAVPVELKAAKLGLIAGGAVLLALAAGSVVLEYKNSALSGNGTLIVVINGGYTRKTVMLKTEKVEFIEDRASMRKRQRKNLSNIRLGVLSEGVQQHFVRNMDRSCFEQIRQRLIY